MDLPRVLGRNVREIRKQRGLSQEQLALDADMKRSYVSDLERGTRNPSLKAVGRLADALNVEAALLLAPLEKADLKPASVKIGRHPDEKFTGDLDPTVD